MIKVGIVGAESQQGGELIRILMHHPEVELTALYAPVLRGRSIAGFHKGVIGETEMKFSDTIDVNEIDVVFLLADTQKVSCLKNIPEELRLIAFPDTGYAEEWSTKETTNYVGGLSEMCRKPLVRGARKAILYQAPAAIALIALYPLALHLLLNDKINIKVRVPSTLGNKFSATKIAEEIERSLSHVQLSFNKIDNIEIEPGSSLRGMEIEIEFPCSVNEKEIEKIYESIYDDHNFTFTVRNNPDIREVAGTQKCLIYISKPTEDTLRIKAVADGMLRGGAGDAIHVMNLLFGLFEKTGLDLQASLAFMEDRLP